MTEKQKNTIFTLHSKGYSDTYIAIQLGYKSGESIRQFRLKNNLKSNGYQYKINYDEADKLLQEGKTYKEISDILNVNSTTLNIHYLKKLGKLSSEKRQSKKIELSQKQKEILFGSLLGDASLRYSSKKSKNVSGSITHSIKQKEYLLFKKNMLKELSSDLVYTKRYHKKTKKYYEAYILRLKTNPNLNEFYNMFYQPKKIVPVNLDLLTPLAIAIWYMDDGYLSKNGYYLSTDSFNKEDLERLSNFLFEKYGLNTHVTKNNRLYINAKSRENFTSLIKPYFCESMLYKLHMQPLNSVNSVETLCLKDNTELNPLVIKENV